MQGEGSSPVKEPAIGDWLRLVIFFVCECYGHDGSGKKWAHGRGSLQQVMLKLYICKSGMESSPN